MEEEGNKQFQCKKCMKLFRDSYNLTQHMQRKRPCDLILVTNDIPVLRNKEEYSCRFCNRKFARPDSLKRHQKNNCRILKDVNGMEILFDHVFARTREREEELKIEIRRLENERASDKKTIDDMATKIRSISAPDTAAGNQIIMNGGHMNVLNVNNNIVINVFGKEDTSHIDHERIRQLLLENMPQTNNEVALREAVLKVVGKTAELIYSDSSHPENITCYIPNKRDGIALIHVDRSDGSKGWEIKPMPQVIPPMAKNSVDLVFDKQPMVEDEEEMKKYGPVLRYMLDCDEKLFSTGAPGTSTMKAVLIRNREKLSEIEIAVPDVGEAAPSKGKEEE